LWFCQTSLQVSRAYSLQHLNIGGTFITDESLYAVANSCTNLKVCLSLSLFLNPKYFSSCKITCLCKQQKLTKTTHEKGFRNSPNLLFEDISIMTFLWYFEFN
jgi:hypothetical protein